MVRASDCGSEGRGFDPHMPPFFTNSSFFILSDITLRCIYEGNIRPESYKNMPLQAEFYDWVIPMGNSIQPKNKNLNRIWKIDSRNYIFALPKVLKQYAEVAQLVEHHLAKVRVAGSSLVFRSKRFHPMLPDGIFCFCSVGCFVLRKLHCFSIKHKRIKHSCPGGEIGRRAGLKILLAAMSVRVQVPPGAHKKATSREVAFFLVTYITHLTTVTSPFL